METSVILEWTGYLASALIVISMLMSSILKLRVINMAGAALFALYGFLIHALPVGFLNLFIVFVNLYFLTKMYSRKEYFKILWVRRDNKYLEAFLNFHAREIQYFFPGFSFNPEKITCAYLILRDMAVAGTFLCIERDKDTLEIELDYVIPEYRDNKPGHFVYKYNSSIFTDQGYKRLIAYPQSKKQQKYCEKMGFEWCENEKCVSLVLN